MGGLPTLEEETAPMLISYRVGRGHLSRERQIPDTEPKEQVKKSIERYPSGVTRRTSPHLDLTELNLWT